MNLLCMLFGHKLKKKPVTDKNYKNFEILCLRCNKKFKKKIIRLKKFIKINGFKTRFIMCNNPQLLQIKEGKKSTVIIERKAVYLNSKN